MNFDIIAIVEATAASERTKGGDFAKSIEIGIERFKIEPQLAAIFRNSIAAIMPPEQRGPEG